MVWVIFQITEKGENTKYNIKDMYLAGYSVFHLQSPSFLAHQERLKHAKGKHNGESLFGFKEIPSDNHIRNSLDMVQVDELKPIFSDLIDLSINKNLAQQGGVVVAIDVVYFSLPKRYRVNAALAKKKMVKPDITMQCSHLY